MRGGPDPQHTPPGPAHQRWHFPAHAYAVDVPRPRAIGHQSVVKQLRSVLFSESILAAASVRPKGYLKVAFAPLLGWWAPLLARRATEPLPPATLYLAVTTADIRLFAKPLLADPFEIGRWKKGSYRASVRQAALGLRLDLDLERLGQVTLNAGRGVGPVFNLVLQDAAGPVR